MRLPLLLRLCPFLLLSACASTPHPDLCPKPQPPNPEAMLPPSYQFQILKALTPDPPSDE